MYHDNGVRPILDPALPDGVAARLRRRPDLLYPADGAVPRRFASPALRFVVEAALLW